jgi:hypothetical protein
MLETASVNVGRERGHVERQPMSVTLTDDRRESMVTIAELVAVRSHSELSRIHPANQTLYYAIIQRRIHLKAE